MENSLYKENVVNVENVENVKNVQFIVNEGEINAALSTLLPRLRADPSLDDDFRLRLLACLLDLTMKSDLKFTKEANGRIKVQRFEWDEDNPTFV